MRNGLNLSGVSELVHELRTKPREALIDFNASARFEGNSSGIGIGTINAGTIRIARDYELPFRAGHADGNAPEPYEYFLTALGGCVMVTYVQGCSVKGVTLTTLAVKVEADLPAAPGNDGPQAATGFRNIRYKVHFDCEGGDPLLEEIAKQVSCFSPNHRTFIESAELGFELAVTGSSGKRRRIGFEAGTEGKGVRSGASGRGRRDSSHAVRLDWKYGTQLEAVPFVRENGEGRSGRALLPVDQPKQVGGIDLAPNPQEYLLAAMCSDLLDGFLASCRAANLEIRSAEVSGTGRLDFRGITNVDPGVPVRIHNLSFAFEVDSDADPDSIRAAMGSAIALSETCKTIREEARIGVEVHRDDRRICAFASDMAATREFLKEMAAKAAAAKRP